MTGITGLSDMMVKWAAGAQLNPAERQAMRAYIDALSRQLSQSNVSTTFIVPQPGIVTEAPFDGVYYHRRNAEWAAKIYYHTDLSAQIDGVVSHFDTTVELGSDAEVFINGLMQLAASVTLDSDNLGFTLDFVPLVGDKLEIISSLDAGGSGGVSSDVGEIARAEFWGFPYASHQIILSTGGITDVTDATITQVLTAGSVYSWKFDTTWAKADSTGTIIIYITDASDNILATIQQSATAGFGMVSHIEYRETSAGGSVTRKVRAKVDTGRMLIYQFLYTLDKMT